MDDEKFIDPRYIEQLRSLPSAPHDDNDDAMALAMAGQAVFHPDSPFVSIESRSHVNTKPEIAARQKGKKQNCPYCDEEMLDNEIGGEPIPEFGKGYAIEHGDIKAFIAKENGKYYLRHNFTPNSSDFFLKMEIKFCPMCGRKLEE